MADEPIELDQHRATTAQRATEVRRRRQQASEPALSGESEPNSGPVSGADPAQHLAELAAKLRYLIELFAATAEARDPQRQALIASALDDIARLLG